MKNLALSLAFIMRFIATRNGLSLKHFLNKGELVSFDDRIKGRRIMASDSCLKKIDSACKTSLQWNVSDKFLGNKNLLCDFNLLANILHPWPVVGRITIDHSRRPVHLLMTRALRILNPNRPFPSCFEPHCKSEAKGRVALSEFFYLLIFGVQIFWQTFLNFQFSVLVALRKFAVPKRL